MTKCCTALILACLISCVACAATLEGRISRVSDGDTIQLLDSDGVRHKVRLAKIDAPESKQEWRRRRKLCRHED